MDKINVLWKVVLVILMMVIAVVAAEWWKKNTVKAPVGTYVTAAPAPEVKLIPKVEIHPRVVKVYAHPAVARLKLPDSMKNQEVLSATEIRSDTRPQSVVSTLNPETGEVTTVVRRDPYKWLEAEQTGEARLSYGYRGGERIARLTASEDLVQVKGINVGGVASLDSDGQTYVGVSVAYRW